MPQKYNTLPANWRHMSSEALNSIYNQLTSHMADCEDEEDREPLDEARDAILDELAVRGYEVGYLGPNPSRGPLS